MTDNGNNEPSNRMRKILYDSEEDSPLDRLPRAASQPSASSPPATPPPVSTQTGTPQPTPNPATFEKIKNFGPPFWTVTGCLSLVVNAVLIAILLAVLPLLGSLEFNPMALGSDVLGGLHTNFEKMDRAHIVTDIQVNPVIPVQFDLSISEQTNVVLSQDVSINGALVTLQTGGLGIVRAPTNIVLPQGTVLPIDLNLVVPVNENIPVSLTVPVDIALNQTDLHEPFVGLQEVFRPYYCLVEPNATSLDAVPLCP